MLYQSLYPSMNMHIYLHILTLEFIFHAFYVDHNTGVDTVLGQETDEEWGQFGALSFLLFN